MYAQFSRSILTTCTMWLHSPANKKKGILLIIHIYKNTNITVQIQRWDSFHNFLVCFQKLKKKEYLWKCKSVFNVYFCLVWYLSVLSVSSRHFNPLSGIVFSLLFCQTYFQLWSFYNDFDTTVKCFLHSKLKQWVPLCHI